MTSIFDLKTSVDELKMSNGGMADMKYQQVTSTRGPLSGDQFPASQIQMDWEMGPDRWWIPSRSYMRIRCKLTQQDGVTPLTMADNIAPNMGLAANLFQKLEFKINNNVVATIAENVPLIDALYNRQNKSKSWLDGTGASFNWWTTDQLTRQSQVSSDGTLVSTGGSASTTVTSRTDLGFDAAGGGGQAERNQWAYTAASGALVYSRGTDGNGLTAVEASEAFPIGSFFRFVGVADTPEVDMEVLENDGAGNLVVDPKLNADVATDGRFDFARVDRISGEDSRRIGGFELIWQPPLSIFGYGGALPVGRYTLLLTPQPRNSYRQFAIESTGANKIPGLGQDYEFEVENMFMYVNTVQGPSIIDQDYVIDLETIESQETQFDGNSFQSEQFTVSPTTYQLTCAFQDSRIGQDTRYSASKFKLAGGLDLNLSRFHIQYAGKTLPSPDYDGQFKTTATALDFTGQMYAESQIYTGSVYSEGSSETIEDWQRRGPYYSFMWPKSGGDMSTRVIVYFKFDVPGGTLIDGNQRLIVFAHSRKAAVVQIRNGMVQNVICQDV